MSKEKKSESISVRLTTEPLHDTERKLTALGYDFAEEDIAALAYELWQARGCPQGSSQEDWFQAVEQLRSRN